MLAHLMTGALAVMVFAMTAWAIHLPFLGEGLEGHAVQSAQTQTFPTFGRTVIFKCELGIDSAATQTECIEVATRITLQGNWDGVQVCMYDAEHCRTLPYFTVPVR